MSGPLPEFLGPITRPASWVYGRVIALRNARFDRGLGITKIDRPVISVGNITIGGTGKTPMAMWIAGQLLEANHRPVIAMRGYGARPGELSDEQAEYAERLPDAPVLANPNRIGALREFLPKNPQIDCVILDDGFQHRQLHRELDLVLIDVKADTFADRLLPAGNLREPLVNLRRADAVIATRVEYVEDDMAELIARFSGRPPIAMARHHWAHLEIFDPNERSAPKRATSAWLSGKRVLTMLGVGNPRSVIQQIEAHGAKVAVNIPCSDHERYDRAKVALARGLCEGCQGMVVTAKDWVKLRIVIDWRQWPVPIVVPRLMIEFVNGAEALRARVLSAVSRF